MEEKLLHSRQRKESDMFERINNHIICRCSLIDKCNCSDESALLTNVEQVVFIFSCFLIEIKSSFQEYQWEITGSRHLLKTLTGFFLYFLTSNLTTMKITNSLKVSDVKTPDCRRRQLHVNQQINISLDSDGLVPSLHAVPYRPSRRPQRTTHDDCIFSAYIHVTLNLHQQRHRPGRSVFTQQKCKESVLSISDSHFLSLQRTLFFRKWEDYWGITLC